MSTEAESVELVGEEIIGNIVRAALFATLTGAFAYVSIPNPLSPVPVSLQVLGVFLAGAFLGPFWGSVSMALYLLSGAVGAPVFAGGSAGIGPLFGYTAGYLWSYPVAATVIGMIVHGRETLHNPDSVGTVRLALALTCGTILIYSLGTIGFALVQNVGLIEAFFLSAIAFIPFEILKIAAAIGIVRSDLAVAA